MCKAYNNNNKSYGIIRSLVTDHYSVFSVIEMETESTSLNSAMKSIFEHGDMFANICNCIMENKLYISLSL